MAESSNARAALHSLDAETRARVLWSALYFFMLLCGYYVLRPLRDEMGILGGVSALPWLFTATFVVMLVAVPLFGACAARFPRRVLLPVVYGFFTASLLVFQGLFRLLDDPVPIARAFFVWVSVYNLFVVSVFWSVMADLFTNAEARRVYGFIAAGGSAGAVAGPALTSVLVEWVPPVDLPAISCVFLIGALVCVNRLLALAPSRGATAGADSERALGGSIWAGMTAVLGKPYLLGIGGFIWLLTTLSTFLYLAQAEIIAGAISDSAERTQLFANMDLATNALTILVQIGVTAPLLRYIGITGMLCLLPLISALGFGVLALFPVLPVLVVLVVLRRVAEYALLRPSREVLFTVVGREDKYKAKNFIDTVVYRGGDALSGWINTGLGVLGLALAGIAALAVPIALGWGALGYWLGRRQEALLGASSRQEAEPHESIHKH